MTEPDPPPRLPWRLRHAWRSASDRTALALCKAHLARAGIDLVDGAPEAGADAIKMHGMEIIDTLRSGTPQLLDLHDAAVAQRWAERLPAFVRRYTQHGAAWYGIPVGVHRSNCMWINAAIAARTGLRVPSDWAGLVGWLHAARRAVPAPLAVGAEPWQIGIVFENLVLATGAASFYRRALIDLDQDALRGTLMQGVLERMNQLRDCVDDAALSLSWSQQLQRVHDGTSALQIMGDWARAAAGAELLEWVVPATTRYFVSVVDFFVPCAPAGGQSDATARQVAARAAAALTEPEFQRAFARIKGSWPALRMDASNGDEHDPRRILLARGDAEEVVVPSLTFDQACTLPAKRALLDVVADHFINRRPARASAARLAGAVSG
ncbi:MAG TPA: extracellular solute-binding protein [Burkholderiaceae bacterium]|nr:extracellular solute-binding protein [Burkholderiaceae bacterium]